MSSVSASLKRVYAFEWLSGTWCTTCRTVQPSGRYGVSSCASFRPRTAARSLAGVAAIASMAARRCRAESDCGPLKLADGIAEVFAHRGNVQATEVDC